MEKLSNINTVKDILQRHGFTFSKSLGQNFLINPSVCPKMAEECGVDSDSGVIEVGPGIGVLTNELAKRAKKVVAVELDKRLLPVLDETLGEYDNVKVINEDVMKLDRNKLIEEEFKGMKVCVCANLPYYITSPIVMRLLIDKLSVPSITFMVQKEAAQRICAEVGTRQCGAVTAAVWYYSRPELLFHVSSGSFMPAPKVDSAVIRLNIRKEPAVSVKDEKLFFKTVRAAFSQRRKNIANSLSTGLSMNKQDIISLLEDCSIPSLKRAEELSMEELGKISDRLSDLFKN